MLEVTHVGIPNVLTHDSNDHRGVVVEGITLSHTVMNNVSKLVGD